LQAHAQTAYSFAARPIATFRGVTAKLRNYIPEEIAMRISNSAYSCSCRISGNRDRVHASNFICDQGKSIDKAAEMMEPERVAGAFLGTFPADLQRK
jgi:hypothetical protein